MAKVRNALGLVSTLALGMAFETAAIAQVAGSDDTDRAIGEEAEPTSLPLNTIVVTAQRREQDIQDVPLSITALSDEFLQNSGVMDLSDIQAYTPNLKIDSGSSSIRPVISIRGVGTSAFNIGLEPSVGIFYDGVYTARASQSIGDLIDVERIEVLRGPQGTLFGKNTTAGLVSVITKAPDFDFGGEVEATLGNYDLQQVRGTITGPVIADSLAFRLTGFGTRRDGYFDNVVTGTDVNDRNRFGFRGQLLFQPSDDLDIRVIGDYTDIDEVCCAAPQIVESAQRSGRIRSGGGTLLPLDPFNRQIAQDIDPVSRVKDAGVSVQVDYDFGNVQLSSITAYRDYGDRENIDADFSDVNVIDPNPSRITINQLSQELRFSGSGPTFDWTAGVFYLDLDLFRDGGNIFGTEVAPFLGLPAVLGPVLFPVGGGNVSNRYEQQTRSYAGFAHVVARVTDSLSLTGGFRYTQEEKDFDARFLINDPRSIIFQPATDFSGDRSEGDYSATASVQYEWSDDIMTFVTWSRGTKSGGFNAVQTAVARNNTTFEPETANSFEAGLRSRLIDRALLFNVTAFRQKTKDFQTNAFDPINGFILTNAGEVRAQGFEWDIQAVPSERFSFGLSGAYTDATFEDFTGAQCFSGQTAAQGCVGGVQDVSGRQKNNAPAWEVSAIANYDTPIGAGNVHFLARAEATLRDDFNPLQSLDPRTELDGYALANFRVGLRADDDFWRVTAWVRNAFDEDYSITAFEYPFASGSFGGFLGDPRTYGITLASSF